MITDISSHSSRYSQSDGKVRYGSGKSSKSFRSVISMQEINKQLKSFTQGKTSRKLENFNPQNQQKTKIKRKYLAYNTNQGLSTKSIITMAIAIVLVLVIMICNINIQVGQDDECWDKFKQSNCDINNVQGKVCSELFKCISKPQYQLSLAMILLGCSSILLGIRFNQQIKDLIVIGVRLWEALINVRKEQKVE